MIRKNSVSIRAIPDSLYELDEFLNSVDIDENKRIKLKIILVEIIENLLHHSDAKYITISVKECSISKKVYLLTLTKTKNFEVIVQNLYKSKIYFSPSENRYRGLGLIICHNLTLSMTYKYTNDCLQVLFILKNN